MTVLRVNTLAGIGTTTFGPTFGGNLEFNSQNYIVLPKGSSTQQGVLRDIPDVVGTGGTFYDNLVLAMPFNQATGLRDVSSRNRNPGTYGDVSISSTISKYYGSSGRFDGSGDYLELVGVGSDFAYDNGNYTMETWFYPSVSISSNTILIDQRNTTPANGQPVLYISSSAKPTFYLEGSGNLITGTTTINPNTWYHISVSKNSGTYTLYLNGSSEGTASNSVNVPTSRVRIGIDYNTTSAFNGHIQDLRVYKGLAKYTADFTPPDRIAEVGVGFAAGQLRYNTDSNLPELYDGNQWVQLSVSQVELGIGANTEPGARGVFGSGDVAAPGQKRDINYFNIASTGDAQDFGDLTSDRSNITGTSSNTRGVTFGGNAPTGTQTIDFITISSTGNASSFGNMAYHRYSAGSCSNSTRGVCAGGIISPPTGTGARENYIEYITIASTGNAVDFGDLTQAKEIYAGGTSSPVRGIFGGGNTGSYINVIEFITLSTIGNAIDFGDLTEVKNNTAAASNHIRGIFAGGEPSGGVNTNVIEYINIASIGNSINFGDLTAARRYPAAAESFTRMTIGNGYTNTQTNIIDYIIMTSQGDAVDFGDLINKSYAGFGFSNAHGGL